MSKENEELKRKVDGLIVLLNKEKEKVETLTDLATRMAVVLAVCNDLMRHMAEELDIELPTYVEWEH